MTHGIITYTRTDSENMPKGWPLCPSCGKLAKSIIIKTEISDVFSWNGSIIERRPKERAAVMRCCNADAEFDASELFAISDHIIASAP